MQIFHDVHSGGFLLMPVKRGQCNNSRCPITPTGEASPRHHCKLEKETLKRQETGNGNRECVTNSDWSQLWRAESGN